MAQQGSKRSSWWLFTLALLLSGCFSTSVRLSPESVSERERLQALAERRVGLIVDPGSFSSVAVGYQYVLIGLPVARVYTPELQADLQEALMLEGGIRRYHLTPLAPSQSASPRLAVTVTHLTVSGYDFLVTRRPSTTIALEGTYIDATKPQKSCRVAAEATHTARFAFSPDLTQALRNAIELAAKELFDCLDGRTVPNHPLTVSHEPPTEVAP